MKFLNGVDIEAGLLVSGNVGIGTASPTYELDVQSSSDANLSLRSTGNGNGVLYLRGPNKWFGIYAGTTTSLNFRDETVGATRMVINTSGNVGIGTTSPTQLLHVSSSTSNPTGIGVQNSQRYYSVRSNNYSLVFTDETVGAERMRINSDGNVGIGTASPDYKLEVNGKIATSAGGIVIEGQEIYANSEYSGNDGGVRINRFGYLGGQTKFRNTVIYNGRGSQILTVDGPTSRVGIGTTSPNEKLTVAGNIHAYAPSGINAGLFASTAAGATSIAIRSSGVTFFNAGNVGIGTTSPATKLHLADTSDVYLTLESTNTSTTEEAAIKYSNFNTGANYWWQGLNQSENWSLGYGTSFSGSTTKLFVSTSGNVGIGTTSPVNAGGNASWLTIDAVSGNAYSGGVAYTIGGTVKAYHYVESNYLRHQSQSGVGHRFTVNAGTQAMIINTSGNVGIGTTSPGQKLHVVGNQVRLDTASGGYYLHNTSGTFRGAFHDNGTVTSIYADGNGSTPAISIDSNNTTFAGDVTIGSASVANAKSLNILTGGSTSSVKLMEAGTVYGFSTLYDGATNKFHINRHNNSAAGTPVLSLNRDDDNATFAGNVLINKASNPTSLQIGSNLADDPFIVFQSDGNTMSMGIDRSDSNKFVISDNATLGTNNILTIDTSGAATFTGNVTVTGSSFLDGLVTIDHNLNIQNNGVLKIAGTEVISATRAINATTGSFSGKVSGGGIHYRSIYNAGTTGFLIETDISSSEYSMFQGRIVLEQFNFNSKQVIEFSATGTSSGAVHTSKGTADIDVTIKLFVYNSKWYLWIPSPSTYTTCTAKVMKSNAYQGSSQAENCIVNLSAAAVPSSGVTGSTDIVCKFSQGNATFAGDVSLADNKKLTFGAAPDFEIYHNSTTNVNHISSLLSRQLSISADTTTFGGDVSLADSKKLKFGAGNDLQIYHDGTHSYIDDQGTGSLKIRGSGAIDLEIADGSKYLARFLADDAVWLYHNGSKKFETTSTGVAVTGKITNLTAGTGNLDAVNVQQLNNATTGTLIYKGTWSAAPTTTSVLDGAISSAGTIVIEAVNPGISVGATVTGTGISGTVTVSSIAADGITIAISSAQTIADGTTLTFTTVGGTPDLSQASRKVTGHYYICETAGAATPNGASTTPNEWAVGDWATFSDLTTDAWQKIDNSSVLSGAGTGGKVPVWSGTGTSVTLADAPITVSGNNATFAGNVAMASGNATGKFAVKSTGVHASYDFYNDGTSYFNGGVVIDAGLSQTGGADATFSGIVGVGSTGVYAGTNAALNLPGKGIALKNDKAGSNNNWSYIENTDTGSASNINFHTGNNAAALTLAHSGDATFTGTVLINGVSNYTGLEVKGVGASRPEIKWSNANNGNLGNIYGTETNALVIATGSGGTTALTLDASQNATFAGNVNLGTAKILNFSGTSFQILHDGSNGLINNSTGDIKIQNSATDKDIIFKVKDGASNVEAMRIDGSANRLGIGVTAPKSKLQVAGGIQMAGDTAAASADKVGTMRYRTGTEYVEVTGTELITNGDFATDSSWTKGANTTISGGSLNSTSAGVYIIAFQAAGLAATKYYKWKATYTVTSGGVRLGDTNTVFTDSTQTSSGTYTGVYQAGTGIDGRIYITSSGSDFVGSIDNISVIEVTAEDASYADMCMQTGASTYEWVNIVRNTY